MEMNNVDQTIDKINEVIQNRVGGNESIEYIKAMAEMTKALAILITARAKIHTD